MLRTLVAVLLLLPGAVHSQTSAECTLDAAPIYSGTQLGRSWLGGSVDGGGGIDVYRLGDAITVSPRSKKFKSIEVLDARNEMFTTVIVDAEMILHTEREEIEVLTDWFDQIILDPRYDWSATVDAAFTGLLFTTEQNGKVLTVRTELGAYVTQGSEPGLNVKEGPFGFHGKVWNINRVFPTESASPIENEDVTFSWTGEGIIIPNLTEIQEDSQTINLDTQNGAQNFVVIDLNLVIGKKMRDLVFRSDPIDRLILVQEPCWDILDVKPDGTRKALAIQTLPQRLSLTAAARHLREGRTGPFSWANVHTPGYRHLSVESRQVLDVIRLNNGGRDVLIARNTGHFRQGSPVLIVGDEGLDEVWLEGSAGWQTEFRDSGVVASVPVDKDTEIELHIGPGIKLKILPTPEFLTNPALLEQPFYPGSPDKETNHEGLYVTRGGYVGLSANQLANKKNVSFFNGSSNVVRISPEQVRNSSEILELEGEPGLDMLLIDEMPEYEFDQAGAIVWNFVGSDGTNQTVKATGFSYITRSQITETLYKD